MNRVEYMTKLASLLQDVPVEERQEAMKYYNDYFDEAGEENEEAVAAELDSPENVAATIKAELYGRTNDTGEYRETGYTDTRFEKKDSLAERGYGYGKKTDKKNSWLKIFGIVSGSIIGIGIIFLVLGIAMGATFSEIESRFPHGFTFHHDIVKESMEDLGHVLQDDERKEFTDIKSVEIDVDRMEVYLMPSETGKMYVESEDVDERVNLRVYQEKGELKIETDHKTQRINNAGTVKIYIPEGTEFYEVDISAGAGYLLAELENVYARKAEIDVAAGEAEISGISADELDLSCGVGSVALTMAGNKNSYNYSVECGIGTVEIGGESYSGLASEKRIHNGQFQNIDIECGIGSVSIDFEQ